MKAKKFAADTLWKALSFQYEPLETQLRQMLTNLKEYEFLKKYNDSTKLDKIRILDNFASKLGL